jgi:hypothetical protein
MNDRGVELVGHDAICVQTTDRALSIGGMPEIGIIMRAVAGKPSRPAHACKDSLSGSLGAWALALIKDGRSKRA